LKSLLLLLVDHPHKPVIESMLVLGQQQDLGWGGTWLI